jgi:hypothetical protein
MAVRGFQFRLVEVTMADEKDRFGDKLREVEKAREDQWAHDQDQKLLEKLRQKPIPELNCPHCNVKLTARRAAGFTIMGCASGHGAWIDHETLEALLKRLK